MGQETAVELAKLGHDVALVARNACTETEERIKKEAPGVTAISYQCDISDPKQVNAMAGKVEQELGSVDILINNAGIYPFMMFEDVTYEAWEKVFCDKRRDGPFRLLQGFSAAYERTRLGAGCQHCVQLFLERRGPKTFGLYFNKRSSNRFNKGLGQ